MGMKRTARMSRVIRRRRLHSHKLLQHPPRRWVRAGADLSVLQKLEREEFEDID